MNRILSLAAALIIAAFALYSSNCGGAAPVVDDNPPSSETSASVPSDTEPAPPDDAVVRIRPVDIQVEPVAPDASDDTLSSTKALRLNAVDENGNTLWEYTSPRCVQTELDTVEYIGVFGDLVYINEQAIYNPDRGENENYDGHLRALDIYTGETVWDNTDFRGASTSFDYNGDTGIIYICGFYGPDCCAINGGGETVFMCGQVDASMWWPYEIHLHDDGIEIVFDGTDSGEGPAYGYVGYDGVPFAG